MADRRYDPNEARRGEPTARRNFRDEFEGAGAYGGSYTAGGPVGAGYGGGYEGYDEGRDESLSALRPYPRPDVPRPSMVVGLGGNAEGYGRGGALDYGYGGMNVGGRDADWGFADVPRGGATLDGSRLGDVRGYAPDYLRDERAPDDHGYGRSGRAGYRRPDYTGRGPRGYRRSDIRINEDVCDALTQDALLDASGIEVRVQSGEVTLAGTVESRQMKRRAEDIAESVRGVADVHNRLRIDAAAGDWARDRELDRDVDVDSGSSVDVMRPGGPAEAYTRAAGTESGESDGT